MISRSFLTVAVMCAWCSIQAQSTLVVLADLYQDPGLYDSYLTEQVVQDISDLVKAHNGPVYSFYCDDTGNHHAFGQQNVFTHLDSVQNGLIEPPIVHTNWTIEGLDLIKKLIQLETSFDVVRLCLFTIGNMDEDYQSEFLFPFTHVVNRIDETGKVDSRLSIEVHSNYDGGINHRITQITTVR